jgi:hypothetical protein
VNRDTLTVQCNVASQKQTDVSKVLTASTIRAPIATTEKAIAFITDAIRTLEMYTGCPVLTGNKTKQNKTRR